MKSLFRAAAHIDRFLVLRWPGLHVTRVHWIALTSLAAQVIAGLVWLGAFPTPADLMSPADVFGIVMILLCCTAVGWLVFRGRGYKLLPVARGFSRAHWVWFDLASVFCILLPAVTIPLAMEARYRGVHGTEEIFDDLFALNPGMDRAQLNSHGYQHPLLGGSFEYNLMSGLGVLSNPADANARAPLSAEFAAILSKYGSKARIDFELPGSASVVGMRQCIENITTYLSAHVQRVYSESDSQYVFLVILGILLGFVLLMNSLPAVEVSGLLCCLGWLGAGSAVLAISGVMDASELVFFGLVFAFMALALFMTVALAFRRKSSLALRASTSVCALLFPVMSTFFLAICLEEGQIGGMEHADAMRVGWIVLVALSVSAPLWQWWVNRLHACPE